jgi:hypothetical protein
MSKRAKHNKPDSPLPTLPGIGGGGSGYSPLPKGDKGVDEVVEKKNKFKRPGHLTDQTLKYNYPKDRQPTLFDFLQDDTKGDIEEAGVEVAEVVEGIKLSPSETKVIDCLCKLLHETSQT